MKDGDTKKYEDFFIKIEYDQNGILHGKYKNQATIDLQTAKTIVRQRKKITGNKRTVGIVDVTDAGNMTNDARSYMAEEEAMDLTNAFAIIASNSFQKLMVTGYIKMNKPTVPTKIFTHNQYQEAIEWAKSFK